VVVKEEDCMFWVARRFYGLSLLHIVVPSVACVHQRLFIVVGGGRWQWVGPRPAISFVNGEWKAILL